MDSIGYSSNNGQRFVRRLVRLWIALSAPSVGLGILLGRNLASCNSNLAGSILLGLFLLASSTFFSRGAALKLWKNAGMNAVLMGIGIPIASVAPISIAGIIVFQNLNYLQAVKHTMCGLSLGVGLLYVVAPIWGIFAAVQRKRFLHQVNARDPSSS